MIILLLIIIQHRAIRPRCPNFVLIYKVDSRVKISVAIYLVINSTLAK